MRGRKRGIGRHDWMRCEKHAQSYPHGTECTACKAEANRPLTVKEAEAMFDALEWARLERELRLERARLDKPKP